MSTIPNVPFAKARTQSSLVESAVEPTLTLSRTTEKGEGVPLSPSIRFRSVSAEDCDFLYEVYASTRRDEFAGTGWDATMIETFLRMQFQLQDVQYRCNGPGATFDIILVDDQPAGRLYLRRPEGEIRLVDIALLPAFRGRGVGSRILKGLVTKADAGGLVISLHVDQINPIRPFYETLGFRQQGEGGVYLYMERQPMPVAPAAMDANP